MEITWREEITREMKAFSDSWENVEDMTFANDQELDRKFDAGYGTSEGDSFCVWTFSRVYFPVVYDGAEWCGSVSRHPDGKPVPHHGGQ